MEDPWQLSVAKLSVAGRTAEAREILRKEIDRGSMAALASFAWRYVGDEITHEEAVALIARIEAEMVDDDEDVHLQLAHAYDMGIAPAPYEERLRRRLQHLERAAELGAGPVHCLAVARIWLAGTLGVVPDRDKAAYWYRRAEEEGNSDAALERRRHGL